MNDYKTCTRGFEIIWNLNDFKDITIRGDYYNILKDNLILEWCYKEGNIIEISEFLFDVIIVDQMLNRINQGSMVTDKP